MGRAIIRRVVGDHVRALHRDGAELWSPTQEQAYVTAVEDAVFGYGRLQPLLQLPDVENIEIHGWNSVVVQYGDGRRETMPPVADSDEELVEAIRFLGQNSEPSRPFDDTHPTMTLALGDRFRLHAIGFGLSYRPSVVIRQHTLTDMSLAELAEGGLMPYEVAEFLDAAILARKSMVISGDQGAGKTTLLRALINSIPANERFGTLETDYELMTHLQPGRENILALQARVGHGETSGGTRVGDVTIADLMPEALRQNLSRLIVGEVRGGEAAAMFEAMQAGTGNAVHDPLALRRVDHRPARLPGRPGRRPHRRRGLPPDRPQHPPPHLRPAGRRDLEGRRAPALRLRDPPGHPGHRERPAGHPSHLLGHRHRRAAGRLLPGRRLRGRAAARSAVPCRARTVGETDHDRRRRGGRRRAAAHRRAARAGPRRAPHRTPRSGPTAPVRRRSLGPAHPPSTRRTRSPPRPDPRWAAWRPGSWSPP